MPIERRRAQTMNNGMNPNGQKPVDGNKSKKIAEKDKDCTIF